MEVASLFFQYLHMLRQQGPQQWVFNEVAAVKDIEFRFQEEEEADEYTVRLARSMHHFRPEHILAGEYMLTDWNETVMSATLERLSPDNMRMDLLTSTFDAEEEAAAAAARGEALETEPWFQVPFSRRVLPASLVAQWRSPPTVDPLLSLPVRNEYIPEDLSLRAALPPAAATQPPPDGEESLTASAAAAPEILIDQQGLRLWHKLDSKFLTPRANVFCAITTTSAYDSPRSAVLSSVRFPDMVSCEWWRVLQSTQRRSHGCVAAHHAHLRR
jgi:nardilysin